MNLFLNYCKQINFELCVILILYDTYNSVIRILHFTLMEDVDRYQMDHVTYLGVKFLFHMKHKNLKYT